MSEALIALPFGLAIGVIVGGVGGGGAILALPVLVYVLGEGVGPASTASLVVVAVAAGIGAGALAFRGHVCWRLALTFSATAAAGSVPGTLASASVSARTLILAFVPVMLVAAAATWRRADGPRQDDTGECPTPGLHRIGLAGLAVGILTGFFGVGGGFLVVPVLTAWLKTSFRRAVATSLVIITITGVAALASHLFAASAMNVQVTVALAGSTGLGALAGTVAAQRLPQRHLGHAFAVLVVAIAVFLAVDALLLGGPPTA